VSAQTANAMSLKAPAARRPTSSSSATPRRRPQGNRRAITEHCRPKLTAAPGRDLPAPRRSGSRVLIVKAGWESRWRRHADVIYSGRHVSCGTTRAPAARSPALRVLRTFRLAASVFHFTRLPSGPMCQKSRRGNGPGNSTSNRPFRQRKFDCTPSDIGCRLQDRLFLNLIFRIR
jgi:hypothetical protein